MVRLGWGQAMAALAWPLGKDCATQHWPLKVRLAAGRDLGDVVCWEWGRSHVLCVGRGPASFAAGLIHWRCMDWIYYWTTARRFRKRRVEVGVPWPTKGIEL